MLARSKLASAKSWSIKVKTTMFGVLAAFFGLLPTNAQQLEQVQAVMWFQIPCNGSLTASGGNQVVFLENYVDQLLPNPVYITSAVTWNEMGSELLLPAGIRGNVTVGVDPGKQYLRASGFPPTQFIMPQFTKTLAAWEIFPSGSIQSWREFSPPIGYRAGQDAILIGPECTTPPGSPLFTMNFSLNIRFQNVGDLTSLPMPIVTYAGYSNDGVSVGNTSTSVRNVVPAKDGTKIRVHASSGPFGKADEPNFSPSVASHVSVCIQSGTGPNCTATPTELRFNATPGVSNGPGSRLWSDWTDFTASLGQNLLVIESFTAAGSNNVIGYRATAPNGVWVSPVDGWNEATMPGSPTFRANRTLGIDGVQQQ